ncbi:MAG: insulinase family protein [Clostridia bacterium]|nr:insulinase family protein [Clostridia bacterium]
MIPSLYTLGDGLRLRVYRTRRFKAGMLSVSAVLPIEGRQVWMTSLLLSVLRRGTVRYPSLAEINRRLDYLYGTELSIRNFYRGDSQIIGLAADLLDTSYLPDADESLTGGVLEVMEQILFHPLLDENGLLDARYVESEKQLQCDQIRSLKNHPRAYAVQQCRQILYDKEPCGVPLYGTEEQVMAVTPAQLTAHWRELKENLTLDCFYVGGEEPATVARALTRTLGGEMSGRAPGEATLYRRVIRRAGQERRRDGTLAVGQGQLVMGMRSGVAMGDPEFYACMVFNELFGASPISKLFMNVREKLSLCYHCASAYDSYKGTLMVTCGLENRNRRRAEKEILRQLKAICQGDFTDAELEGAKSSLENGYRQLEDSPAAMESYYYGRALAGVDQSLEHCRACFGAVTREDVIAVAKGISVDTVFFLKGTLSREEVACDDECME